MATAAYRNSGSFDTLATHVLPKWWNAAKAEDVIFEPSPLLWILSQVAKKSSALPADIVVRMLQDKGAGVDSFSRYDTVSTSPSKGAQAARFTVANYSAPIPMSLEEEWEFTSPEAVANRLEELVEQQQLTLADRLAVDLYKGNDAKSTNVVGLEQIVFAETHLDDFPSTAEGTLAYITDLNFTRQAANTLGGIARTAWTSATGGGTGWENVAVDFFAASANRFTFDSSGAPEVELQVLTQTYNFCSRGIIHPDLMLSDDTPFDDYEFAGATKMRLTRESSGFGDLQLGYDNLKFKNAIWIRDANAKTQNATSSPSGSDATNGKGNIYFLNTKMLDLAVDSRADFSLTPTRQIADQHAGVMHMLWRGQLIPKNPRYLGRIFDYVA